MTKTTRSPRPAFNAGARERIQLPNSAVSGWTNQAVLRKRADLGPVVFVLMIASVQGFLFLQSSQAKVIILRIGIGAPFTPEFR